jgi:dihydrofolate synthase/folylpolyglutamate synthase
MVADLALEGLRLNDLEIGLWGGHQVTNAAIAVVLAREWLVRHRPRLSADDVAAAVRSGLRSVAWPCRCERVERDPDVFVDVGHTPAAIAALVHTIAPLLGDRRLLVVTGVSANREARSIVHPLVGVADRVVCTRAYHLGRSASEIAELVAERQPEVPCRVEERIEQAVARAVEEAAREGMTVLVAGGVFLAAEAVIALRGGDPEGLQFPTPSP